MSSGFPNNTWVIIVADKFFLLSTKKYVEAAPAQPNSPIDPKLFCFDGSSKVLQPRPHP